MRIAFIGGPGRSGTTYVVDRLARHPNVASFGRIELKIFAELGGLGDLAESLSDRFSPNRARMALHRFEGIVGQLRRGGYDQPALAGPAWDDGLEAALRTFQQALHRDGIPVRQKRERFLAAARRLLADLAAVADAGRGAPLFVEKTPHNLLNHRFLREVAPGCRLVHVIRDPRATAVSLTTVAWGVGTIPAACTWVESYFDAWFDAREAMRAAGTELLEMRIEEVCDAPRDWDGRVREHLGLAAGPDLFMDADRGIVDGWRARLAPEAAAGLEARLGGLVARLGYER